MSLRLWLTVVRTFDACPPALMKATVDTSWAFGGTLVTLMIAFKVESLAVGVQQDLFSTRPLIFLAAVAAGVWCLSALIIRRGHRDEYVWFPQRRHYGYAAMMMLGAALYGASVPLLIGDTDSLSLVGAMMMFLATAPSFLAVGLRFFGFQYVGPAVGHQQG